MTFYSLVYQESMSTRVQGDSSALRPGLVDCDLGVLPSCLAAQPLLPTSHQPKQNWADDGTTQFIVNPTQVSEQMNNPVCYVELHN